MNTKGTIVTLALSALLVVQLIPAPVFARLAGDIVLDDDLRRYHHQMQLLSESRQEDEAALLKMKKTPLSELNITPRDEIKSAPLPRAQLEPGSEQEISIEQFSLVEKDFKSVVHSAEQPKVGGVSISKPQAVVGKFRFEVPSAQKQEERSAAFLQRLLTTPAKVSAVLRGLFATPVYAQAFVPLIEHYDGIEDYVLDYALYYLSQNQNNDGSFGSVDTMVVTAAVVNQLALWGREHNHQFVDGVNYVLGFEPTNNRERAWKIRILRSLQVDYDALLQEVLQSRNVDGGFGLTAQLHSDPHTTAEVIQALTYIEHDADNSIAMALHYLTSKVQEDGSMRYGAQADAHVELMALALQTLYPYRNAHVGDNENQQPIADSTDALLTHLDHMDTATFDVADMALAVRSFRLYGVHQEKIEDLSNLLRQKNHSEGGFDHAVLTTMFAMQALSEPELQVVSVANNGAKQNRQATTFLVTLKNNGYEQTGAIDLRGFVDGVALYHMQNVDQAGVVLQPGASATINLNINDTAGYVGDVAIDWYAQSSQDFKPDNNWARGIFAFDPAADGTPAIPLFGLVQKYTWDNGPGLNIRWHHKADPARALYTTYIRPQGQAQWHRLHLGGLDGNGWFMNARNYPLQEDGVYEVTPGVLGHQGQQAAYGRVYTVTVSGNENAYKGSARIHAKKDGKALSDAYVWAFGASGDTNSDGVALDPLVDSGGNAARVDVPHLEPFWTRFDVAPNVLTDNVEVFTRFVDDSQGPQVDTFEIRFEDDARFHNQNTEHILLTGQDESTIERATFELWDPAQQRWVFLADVKSINHTQVLYQWDVPEMIEGQGYRLRAVAYDPIGNASESALWGPFEVVSGSPPIFNVTAPNGGEQWTTGSEQTISWDTQSVNGVDRVSVYAVYPNTTDVLASGIDNVGQYTWNIPNNISFASDQVKIKVFGQDNQTGVEGEDYSDEFFAIEAVIAGFDAPWQEPEQFTDVQQLNPSGGSVGKTLVKYDENGTAHVLYRYLHDTYVAPRVITEQVYYRQYQNDQWSQATLVLDRSFNTDAGLDNYEPIGQWDMALDDNGYPHVLWHSQISGGCGAYNQQEIFYMAYDGNRWSNPLNISNNNTESSYASIARGEDNTMHLLWRDGWTRADDCRTADQEYDNMRLFHRSITPGGNMSDIAMFGAGERPGWIVIDGQGGPLHMVYRATDGYKHRSFGGGQWSGPQAVPATNGGDLSDVAVGPNGSVHFLQREYYQDPQLDNQWRTRLLHSVFDGNQWSDQQDLTPQIEGYQANEPHIMIDAQNRPHAVYKTRRPAGRDTIAWVSKNGQNWGQAAHGTLESQGVEGNTMSAGINAQNGQIMATWASWFGGRPEGFANWLDGSVDLSPPDLPQGLRTESSAHHITVRWDEVPEGSVFTLYRSEDDQIAVEELEPIARIADGSTEYVDRDVEDGLSYYYGAVLSSAAGVDSAATPWAGPVALTHQMVYEDAEDGTTNGWAFWGADREGATVENVMDIDKNSRVISLSAPAGNNINFRLKDDNDRGWNNEDFTVLSMDMKFNRRTIIFVHVSTQEGWRYMTYRPGKNRNWLSGHYANIGMPAELNNGQWQTMTVDLQADLQLVEPGNQIEIVNFMLVGGPGSVDNIMLMDQAELSSVSGTVVDSNGDPIENAVITLSPGGGETTTSQDGTYRMERIPYGEYELAAQKEGFMFDSSPRVLQANRDSHVEDFTASVLDRVVYEDAEDGTTDGWSYWGHGEAEVSVENVFDEDRQSRVIELSRPEGNGVNFSLRQEDGANWNNTEHKVLSMDMKFSGRTTIFVNVTTSNGWRYMEYRPGRLDSILNGNYARMAVPAFYANDQWHTLERDLQADLSSVEPDAILERVNFMLVAGDGRLDNVLLQQNVEQEQMQFSTLSGIITREDGGGISGANVGLMELGVSARSQADGTYRLESIPYGQYTLGVQAAGSTFEQSPLQITVDQAEHSFDFQATALSEVLYEDAEDGTTDGWTYWGNGEVDVTVENVFDEDSQSRVIELNKPEGNNANFALRQDNGANWNNTEQRVLSVDMKFSGRITFFVNVNTTNGWRYMEYRPGRDQSVLTGNYARMAVPLYFANGQWHAFERDLQADLHSVEPDATITQVNFMLVSGAGRLDNVKLKAEMGDQQEVGVVRGRVATADGTAVVGAQIHLQELGVSVATDHNGTFSFIDIPHGNYTILATDATYQFEENPLAITVDSPQTDVVFVAQAPAFVMYEDAQDGTIDRWDYWGNGDQDVSIENIFDEERDSRVIQTQRPHGNNANFVLTTASGRKWNNYVHREINFDMNFTGRTNFFVQVSTNNGWRYLEYRPGRDQSELSGNYARIATPLELANGQWQAFSANLQEDLNTVEPDAIIEKVNFLIVAGSGKIDNIQLSQ